MNTLPEELEKIYRTRFAANQDYRRRVWEELTRHFFARWVRPTDTVLDLGCGYGEFINQIQCAKKFGMDLNPESPKHLAPGVEFLQQDCSQPWAVAEGTLDVVFTSNFFEHLPSKESLGATLEHAHRSLKPGGRLIALGPNIKYLPGAYWDFWDHYLPLTELSLAEGLRNRGFEIETNHARFLPYTMVNAPQYPTILLRLYLSVPILWRFFGGQFLVVARKRGG